MDIARATVDKGIITIVAKPHYDQDFRNERTFILDKVEQLNERLAEEKISLAILPGQEDAICERILEELDKGIIQVY